MCGISRCSIVALFLACFLTLASCQHSGSQFLGNWVSVADPNLRFEITRNDDQFLVIMQSGYDAGSKYGATYRDGSLEVSTGVKINYIKNSDTLSVPRGPGTGEFKRQQ